MNPSSKTPRTDEIDRTKFDRHPGRQFYFTAYQIMLEHAKQLELELNAALPANNFIFNQSGSKYLRDVTCAIGGRVDVYAVIEAFDVRCPARQHAVKKLLCSGIRGKGGVMQDLREARDAIDRAIQMQTARDSAESPIPTSLKPSLQSS